MNEFSIQALDEYRTTHFLDVYNQCLMVGKTQITCAQASVYPFDIFYLETHIVAINLNDTNFGAIPIVSIGFSGYSSNLAPYVIDVASTALINGTAVTSRIAYLTLKRTNVSKGFVLVIFAINWLLTLTVVNVMLMALFVKDLQMPEGIGVLPVSVILTLTGLRALFVDSPPFGELLNLCQMIVTNSRHIHRHFTR